MNKTCTKCGVEYCRTKEYFAPDKKRKDGFSSWCKKCANINSTNWAKKNPEKHRKSSRKYYQQNKEKCCEWQQNYAKTFKGYVVHLVNHIKQRCTNSNHVGYKYYGKRGIKCEFTVDELYNWLIVNKIDPQSLEIHRINNDNNYTLNNIRFLDRDAHAKAHSGVKYTKNF